MKLIPSLAVGLALALLLAGCGGASGLEVGDGAATGTGTTTGAATTTGTPTGGTTGGGATTTTGTTTATGGSGGGDSQVADCSQGTFDGVACSAPGDRCAGIGPWQGWTCSCAAKAGSTTWACAKASGTETSCQQGTFDGATCKAAGETCSGPGKWTGWTCTCAASAGGTTWSCKGG